MLHGSRLSTQFERSQFKVIARTKEEEDQYDLVKHRSLSKPSGTLASITHMVKSGLGAGILDAHIAYKHGGSLVSLLLSVILGAYMTYCLAILGQSAQTLYKRLHIPMLSYPDIGEAAMACHSNAKIRSCAKYFRIYICFIICVELYGACATYQIIMASTIKQLVEDVPQAKTAPSYPGYPSLRMYVLMIWIPCVIICLIRHLQYLAQFSTIGNILLLMCVVITIYYAMIMNPTLSNMAPSTDIEGTFMFMGLIVFGMSCAGGVMAIENNMKNPRNFNVVLFIGMTIIIIFVGMIGFFGYAAYLDNCQSPITFNYPMGTLSKIMKAGIAMMIYFTHALNFWIPFDYTYYYIKERIKPENHIIYEYLYRPLFVTLVTAVAFLFPNVSSLMAFLGCFCISNMAFMFPAAIYLLIVWDSPGLGAYNWRLLISITIIIIGLILFVAGSLVASKHLVKLFIDKAVAEEF